MVCEKCLGSGWLCELHENLPQYHRIELEWPFPNACPAAGKACDCEAFPHKKRTATNSAWPYEKELHTEIERLRNDLKIAVEALEKAVSVIGDSNNGPPQFYSDLFDDLEQALERLKGKI